ICDVWGWKVCCLRDILRSRKLRSLFSHCRWTAEDSVTDRACSVSSDAPRFCHVSLLRQYPESLMRPVQVFNNPIPKVTSLDVTAWELTCTAHTMSPRYAVIRV